MRKTILVVALLAGCGGTPPQETGDALTPATRVAALPTATDAAPAASAPATDTTPEALVISTNEPFWQVRIEGDTLVLTGVDSAERRLAVESSVAITAGRVVRARDARGSVEAVVSNRPCEDDMSGARFPLTGALTIDGVGPLRGCSRPASMPPPGEPGDEASAAATAQIPEPWLGRWAPTEEACRNPDNSIEGLTISARELRFHESIGVPNAVEVIASDTLRLTSDYDGEGQQWTSIQVLRLSDGGNALEVEGPGDFRMQRIRCSES